jgi:hypothetical protein
MNGGASSTEPPAGAPGLGTARIGSGGLHAGVGQQYLKKPRPNPQSITVGPFPRGGERRVLQRSFQSTAFAQVFHQACAVPRVRARSDVRASDLRDHRWRRDRRRSAVFRGVQRRFDPASCDGFTRWTKFGWGRRQWGVLLLALQAMIDFNCCEPCVSVSSGSLSMQSWRHL